MGKDYYTLKINQTNSLCFLKTSLVHLFIFFVAQPKKASYFFPSLSLFLSLKRSPPQHRRSISVGPPPIYAGGSFGSTNANFPTATTSSPSSSFGGIGSGNGSGFFPSGNICPTGKIVKTMAMYDRAIQASPENPAYRGNRAAALTALGGSARPQGSARRPSGSIRATAGLTIGSLLSISGECFLLRDCGVGVEGMCERF